MGVTQRVARVHLRLLKLVQNSDAAVVMVDCAVSVGQVSQRVSSRVSLAAVRRYRQQGRRRSHRVDPVHDAARRRRRRRRGPPCRGRGRAARDVAGTSAQSVRPTSPPAGDQDDRPTTVADRTQPAAATRPEMRAEPTTTGGKI